MAINYVEHIQILINKLQTMTLIFHFISSRAISARQRAFFGEVCAKHSCSHARSKEENFRHKSFPLIFIKFTRVHSFVHYEKQFRSFKAIFQGEEKHGKEQISVSTPSTWGGKCLMEFLGDISFESDDLTLLSGE
jgi:hypothetical protein